MKNPSTRFPMLLSLAFAVASTIGTPAQNPPPPPIQPPDLGPADQGFGPGGLAPVPGTIPAESGYELVNAFPAQSRFDRPIHLDHHPADPGVYYLVEQYGNIYRIPRDGTKSGRTLFLDWSEQSLSPKDPGGNNEEGLLGFAFDPEFADNGFVYLYYSRKTGEKTNVRTGKPYPLRESVVARLKTADKDGQRVADAASELVLLRVEQPFGNHNGGTIVFGPDKMLYIALGDGGYRDDPYDNGQRLDTLLAKILRIDVRDATAAQPYAIPKDNPFVGRKGARGEIWAYGLRNPWRIAFDRKTGDLWCGDVGQELWEEVDRIVKGGNYGWNRMEGTHAFKPRPSPFGKPRRAPAPKSSPPSKTKPKSGAEATEIPVLTGQPTQKGKPPQKGKPEFLAPVVEYHHKEGVSITGGHVYRGKTMPELDGCYLYADYVSGRLWAVRENRKGGAHQVSLLTRQAGAVASFAEGPAGEVFVLRYDGDKVSRLVRRKTGPKDPPKK